METLLHFLNCKLCPFKKKMEYFKRYLFEVVLKQRNFRKLIFTSESFQEVVCYEE